MKAIKYISMAVIAIGITACTYDINPEKLYLSEDGVKELTADGKIYHLEELLDVFCTTEEGNYLSDSSLYRSRATGGDGIYLFSIDTLPSTGAGIYIRGRVTTDDHGGNFYKSLIIQEMVDGKQQNLRLSVDLGSASGMYPRGQEILIRCNGLAVGRYSNQPQLCVPSYNNNTNAANGAQKVGWNPGRIPAPFCRQNFHLIGLPDASKLHYDTLTVAECIAKYDDIKAARKTDGKLVVVKNIWFNGKCNDNGKETDCHIYSPDSVNAVNPDNKNWGNPEHDGLSAVFGPTTGNVGYPQSRYVTDGTKSVLVSTSEYAKYAYFYLPFEEVNDKVVYGTFKGSVRGILGYYKDKASAKLEETLWSITICDLSDLDLKADGTGVLPAGTPWSPEEWVK